jgi:hypothetical protein
MGKDYIEIVNPTGQRKTKQGALASRNFENLRGRRIGLLDNNKPNADKFLQFIGAMLRERYADIELVAKRKMTRMEADGLADFAGRCDVVINAFAD